MLSMEDGNDDLEIGNLIDTDLEAVDVDAGRFIAPTGAQVVELGPVNDSIHTINEHVNINEIDTLSRIYQSILDHLLC